MVKSVLFTSMVLPLSISLFAQSALPTLEFSNPVPIEGPINSSSEELYPLVAPKKGLFFVRAFHKENTGGLYGGQDIWLAAATQSPKAFMTPSNKDFRYNGKENNAVVGISSDGNKVWMLSSYPVEDGRKIGLSTSVFSDGQWSAPEVFDIPQLAFAGEFLGVNVSPDGEAVFFAMQSAASVGREDIYVIYKSENQWVGPINLGVGVNSEAAEISPFYDANLNLLFFASNRKGGVGDMDIYYTAKADQTWTQWTEPVMAPAPINSASFDGYFSSSPEGEAYFVSNRNGSMGDIFHSRVEVVSPEEKEEEVTPVAQETTEEEKPAEAAPVTETIAETPVSPETPKSTESPVAPVAPAAPVTPVAETPKALEAPVSSAEFPAEARVLRAVYFAFEKTLPKTSRDYLVLDTVARLMTENPNLTLSIAGHTDNIGTRKVNIYYSRSRAQRVRDQLVKRGIPMTRMEMSWHAFDKPAASNATSAGRALNRRSELKFGMKP
jgi:OOP family OmpA-OmpF porin